jgi:hypothetical protein
VKRIAGVLSIASIAFIAHACAHLEVHFGAPHTPVALHEAHEDPLVSNGIDGGRPPAEHVDD